MDNKDKNEYTTFNPGNKDDLLIVDIIVYIYVSYIKQIVYLRFIY